MLEDLLHIFYPRTYTLGNGKTVREKFNPLPYVIIAFTVFIIFCAKFGSADYFV